MSVTISREQRQILWAAARDLPTPAEIQRAEDDGREMDAILLRMRHQHQSELLDTIGWEENSRRQEIRLAHTWREARAIGTALSELHRHAHEQVRSTVDDDAGGWSLEVLGICCFVLAELTYDPFTGGRELALTLPASFPSKTVSDVKEMFAARERRGLGIHRRPDPRLPVTPESERLSELAVRELAGIRPVAWVPARSRYLLHRMLIEELGLAADVQLCAAAGDMPGARALRLRFEDAARLMDDLGWGEYDPCTHFEITVPHTQLARTLLRLHIDARTSIYKIADTAGEREDAVRDALAVTGVSIGLLSEIVSQHDDLIDGEAA